MTPAREEGRAGHAGTRGTTVVGDEESESSFVSSPCRGSFHRNVNRDASVPPATILRASSVPQMRSRRRRSNGEKMTWHESSVSSTGGSPSRGDLAKGKERISG